MLDKLKSLFKCETGREKIYKFKYYLIDDSSWSRQRTLVIDAKNAVEAVKKLHAMTKNKVSDILEFTEIRYGVSDAKEEIGLDERVRSESEACEV